MPPREGCRLFVGHDDGAEVGETAPQLSRNRRTGPASIPKLGLADILARLGNLWPKPSPRRTSSLNLGIRARASAAARHLNRSRAWPLLPANQARTRRVLKHRLPEYRLQLTLAVVARNMLEAARSTAMSPQESPCRPVWSDLAASDSQKGKSTWRTRDKSQTSLSRSNPFDLGPCQTLVGINGLGPRNGKAIKGKTCQKPETL